MNRQVKANQGTDKHIVCINKTTILVSKEVFNLIHRDKENQRYRARRDGKCGTSDFRLCHGDCGYCSWVREGFNMLSYDKTFGTESSYDLENDQSFINSIPDTSASQVEDIVANRDLLDRLMRKLDTIVPDGGQIIQMLMDEYTDRQMVKALKLTSQSSLNYRKRKVQQYLREHWHDFFE